jgi:transcriptional regulator with XRE-family HTH domain
MIEPLPRTRPLLRTLLGDVLRRIRLEQNRTLADVAEIARVSMPYLSELERGRKEASSEVLAAICDALAVDLSEVLAEVRRDLLGERRTPLIRLGSVGDQRLPETGRRLAGPAGAVRDPVDAVCLLAA